MSSTAVSIRLSTEIEEPSKPCGDCRSMIHITDQKVNRMTAGTPDFCGKGCLMVGQIRVPHPDCGTHSNLFTPTQSVVQ